MGGSSKLDKLKAIGASAGDLRAAGVSAQALSEVGYTAKELLIAGFSAKELIECGFGVPELREAGFNAIQLRALGFALPLTFWDSLSKTIRWMVSNPDWLDQKNFGMSEEQMYAQGGGLKMSTLAPGGGIKEVLDGKGGASGRDSAGFISKL